MTDGNLPNPPPPAPAVIVAVLCLLFSGFGIIYSLLMFRGVPGQATARATVLLGLLFNGAVIVSAIGVLRWRFWARAALEIALWFKLALALYAVWFALSKTNRLSWGPAFFFITPLYYVVLIGLLRRTNVRRAFQIGAPY